MATPIPATPKIIAVGGLKGGIGKSTLAMFLAFVFAKIYGLRVLLVDADPSSQTGYDWWSLARDKGKNLPIDIETWPHGRVGQMIMDRTPGKYHVVIADCGGDSDSILSSVVAVAHYVLIATTPFKADIRRVAPTFQAAAKAVQAAGRAKDVIASVVLLKVDNRMKTKNKERFDNVAEHLPILDAKMSLQPAVYADAFADGVPPDSDLAEVHEIAKEIGATG